ncbi:MAG: hypothetical protein AB1726_12675 [Planctomycetota bacterium]
MTMLPVPDGSSPPNRPPIPRGSLLRAAVPALLLASIATPLVLPRGEARGLAAAGTPSADSDGDGLVDLQEEVLLTDPDRPDTDGDSYSDLEEIARQTDPCNKFSWPSSGGPKVGMAARVEGGTLTLVSAFFVEGSSFVEFDYEFGMAIQGLAIPLDLWQYAGITRLSILAVHGGAGKILLLQTSVPESLVLSLGFLSLWAVHEGDATSGVRSAATLNLVAVGGTMARLEPAPQKIQGGVETILRPLAADDGIPTDWTGGQICWQQSSVVGANGASLVFQVDSAGCEQMDTYCSPSDCEATVGATYETIDPGALVGG